MHAEHRRPLYAFCVLALASALLIGQGLRVQAFYEYFVGGRGEGAIEVAAGSTITASPETVNAARGTTAVAEPERRTDVDRPSPALSTRSAQTAHPTSQTAHATSRAPGHGQKAAGKARGSRSKDHLGRASRGERATLDGSQRTSRADVHSAKGKSTKDKSKGHAKAKSQAKSKAKKSKAKKSKSKKSKSKAKKSKRHPRTRRHGR